MRDKKPMWHCGESKCLLLNSWRCSTCNCVDELTNWLMDWIAMASVEPEVVVKAPKKKRSKKKKIEEVIEEIVEDTPEVPEVLSLEELSK